MNLWLVVPVKPFGEGKSRLAGVLDPAARSGLSRSLLGRTLTTASATGLFVAVLVVSRDAAVRRFARTLGALTLREQGRDLNLALDQASRQVQQHGAAAMLVLPADLPGIAATDLEMICRLGLEAADVVLSPSHDGGTNALFMRLPPLLPFMFGPDSFIHHRRSAEGSGCRVAVYYSPSVSFDVDQPADLALLAAQWGGDSMAPWPALRAPADRAHSW